MSLLLLGAGGAGLFSPASLPDFVSEFNVSRALATGNLWQNTAETIPAVANNDPVRVLVDPLSGVKYTAPSDAARGLLKISGGYSWIQTDGVDDCYVSTGGLSSFTAPFTAGFSGLSTTTTPNQAPIGAGQSSGRLSLAFVGSFLSSSPLGLFRIEQAVLSTNLTYSANTALSVVWSGESSGDPITLWKDGVQSSTSPDANASSSDTIVISNGFGGADFFSGRYYGCVFYSSVLSNSNRILLETYLASLYPPFSPDQLPGFVSEFNVSRALATGNLWQNTAETVPAVANNDPVRVLVDPLSGVKYTAPSDAARGLLKISGSYAWIETDGVDDCYRTTGLSFASTSHTWGLATSTPSSGNKPILDVQSGRLILYPNGNLIDPTAAGWFSGSTGTTLGVSSGSSSWNSGVFTFSGSTGNYHRDGSLIGSGSYTAVSAGGTTSIGATFDNFNFAVHYLAGIVVFSQALSESNRSLLTNYLNGLTP